MAGLQSMGSSMSTLTHTHGPAHSRAVDLHTSSN